MNPPLLEALLQTLYASSSHSDTVTRSRIASALDLMPAYVGFWRAAAPARVAALFERLEPVRLVRVVGQTLLAATRLTDDCSAARQAFLVRFLADLRVRGTSKAVIARLEKGL